jgi:hypothetical protein
VGTRKFMVAGAALIMLAGCSHSGEVTAPVASRTPGPEAAAEASVAAAARAKAVGDVDSYVAALKAIDPKLAADKDSALGNGKTVCLAIGKGQSEEQLAAAAANLWSVSESRATQIVAATRAKLCPTA